MTIAAPTPFLRDPSLIYRLDAAICLFMGLGLIALAPPLAALTGWSPMEIIIPGAGIFLLPWALSNWTIGCAGAPDRLSLVANILGDGLWILASAFLLVLYSAQMTGIGVTLIAAQALFVAGVFALKLAGLKARRG